MIILYQSAPVCHAELTFEDTNNGEIIAIDWTIAGTDINVNTQQLVPNRYYSVTVTASNFAGSNTNETMISKFVSILPKGSMAFRDPEGWVVVKQETKQDRCRVNGSRWISCTTYDSERFFCMLSIIITPPPPPSPSYPDLPYVHVKSLVLAASSSKTHNCKIKRSLFLLP